MKLIFDVAKFVVVNFARLVLLATVVGLGVLARKHVQEKTSEGALESMEKLFSDLQELRANEASALETLNTAKNAYDAAQISFERARKSAQEALDRAVAEQQGPLRDQQLADSHYYSVLAKFGSENELTFSPDQIEESFVTLCHEYAKINHNFCKEWRDLAKQLSQKSPENWPTRLEEALDSKCAVGDALGAMVRDRRGAELGVCLLGKSIVRDFGNSFSGGVAGYQKLQAARKKFDEATAVVTSAAADLTNLATTMNASETEQDWLDAQKEYQDIQSAIQTTQANLDALRSDPWIRIVEGYRWFVENLFKKYWFTALMILLMPYVIAALVYRGASSVEALPLFSLRNPRKERTFVGATSSAVEFYEKLSDGDGEGSVKMEMGVRQQTVRLAATDKLVVRAEYVASSRNGTTAVFLSRRHWCTSYAAGMWGLTKFTGEKTPEVVLSASGVEQHGEYIAKVSLENHPGFVVRPSRLVAVKGDLVLKSRCDLRWVALLRLQIRYFYFSGTGELYVSAPGGILPRVVGTPDAPEGREHLSHDLILGWDGRLGLGFARNENFIQSALLRRQDLFESALTGHGPYLQGHSSKEHKVSGATKLFSGFLDIVLKIFGI